MMAESLIWQTLGVEATRNAGEIRRAYATKLKAIDAEEDPEGFRLLRSAYEGALALAKRPQVTVVTASAPASPAAPMSPTAPASPAAAPLPRSVRTPVEPQPLARAPNAGPTNAAFVEQTTIAAEITAVRAAFDALRRALQPDSTAGRGQLEELLERTVETAARGNLTIQQDTENAIAQLMAAAIPRSDVLLDECVRRYDWEKHEANLTPNRTVLAVLARRRDVARLADLQSRQDAWGIGFRRLAHPAQPLLRWWRANFSEIGQWPEWAVLRGLKDHNPMLLRELNAAQIAWWERFMSRPRLSFSMVRVGGKLIAVFVLMLLVGGFLTPDPWYEHPLVAMALVALYALALVARLYLIDWPIHLVLRRWGGAPPPKIQLGWLPGLILLFGVTIVFKDAPALWWLPALLGTLGCLWAIYVSGPMPSVYQPNRSFVLTNSHLFMAAITNAAIALWWFLAQAEFTTPTAPAQFGTRSAAALSLMCAASFGLGVLNKVWMERITGKQRKHFTLALLLLALALAPVAWFGAARPALRPLLAWLVITFVVIHRVACTSFSTEQLRLRVFALVAASIAGSIVGPMNVIPMEAPVIQLGSAILFGVAALSLIIALRNQRERGY